MIFCWLLIRERLSETWCLTDTFMNIDFSFLVVERMS